MDKKKALRILVGISCLALAAVGFFGIVKLAASGDLEQGIREAGSQQIASLIIVEEKIDLPNQQPVEEPWGDGDNGRVDSAGGSFLDPDLTPPETMEPAREPSPTPKSTPEQAEESTPAPTKSPSPTPEQKNTPTPAPTPTSEPVPTATPFVCPKPADLTWPDSAYSDGKILVMLDAGHGGRDGGTLTQDQKTCEKDINLSVVKKIQACLEECGVTVVLTRDGDTSLSLQERVDCCNSMDTDVFVSIHVNSYDKSSKVAGMECYYYKNSKPCKSLAQDVDSYMKNQAGIKTRGARGNEYFVLKNTACTAILVEMGYITNPTDAANLLSDEYQSSFAQALADAIISSLGYERQ